MDVNSISTLLEDLHSDDLVFAYTGSVSDTITHKIIELTQFNIDSSGSFVKIKNKISFLMAECYQNVARHGKYAFSEEMNVDYHGAFYVRSSGNTFFIASANTVKRDDITTITDKLDKVNSLSGPELRLLQKEVLSRGKLSDRGGAGLGIIEMARKTGQKILYDFVPIDEMFSIFFIQLTLQPSDGEELSKQDNLLSLENMKAFHGKMMKENLIILHKGDFSENSVLPIIQMIEKNILNTQDVKQGKQKLYNVSVELLQNISMHAQRINNVNEALLVLERNNSNFIIGASNFIDSIKMDGIKTHLDNLSKLSKPELNALYRERLKQIISDDGCSLGIGLIYLFRKSDEVRYSIRPIQNRMLLTFIVTV